MNLLSHVTLPNQVKIPSIGYGTWKLPPGEETEAAIKNALDAGYRHIDTAVAYGNDFSVGEAINTHAVDRKDIIVANKLWNAKRGYDSTLKAFRQTLKRLGFEYIDLYLIHWPASSKLYDNWREINSETWRAFETLYRDGYIKAIGVSNFTPFYLRALLETAQIVPMVNQIEYHPGYVQAETVALCRDNAIQVEAWSPLGSGRMLGRPELQDIAKKYNKSAAQICIRWCLQKEIVPVPKSATPERMKENISVFDFELSPEDMACIDALPDFGGSGLDPDNFETGQQGGG